MLKGYSFGLGASTATVGGLFDSDTRGADPDQVVRLEIAPV
jgi:hypothetical protein